MNLEKKKIHSNYAGKDFESMMHSKDIDGREAFVVMHESLEDIILNQMEEYGIKYDFQTEVVTDKHAVVKCTMYDKNRRVVQIGESVPATLTNDISINYPVTMAANRAFDRCAIRFLGIEGKVFSRYELDLATLPEEIAPTDAVPKKQAPVEPKASAKEKQPVTQAEKPAASATKPAPKAAPKPAAKPVEAVEEEDVEVLPDLTEEQEIFDRVTGVAEAQTEEIATAEEVEEMVEEVPEEVVEEAPAEEDPHGSVMINFGRYMASPKTIAEVYNENKRFLTFWLTGSFKPKTDEQRAVVEHARQYLASKGE